MDVDALHLNILQFKCTACGQAWIHSEPWLASAAHGPRGGSPSQLHEKLPFLSMENEPLLRLVPGCHRCVPLALGVGWQKPWKSAKIDPSKPAERVKDILLS